MQERRLLNKVKSTTVLLSFICGAVFSLRLLFYWTDVEELAVPFVMETIDNTPFQKKIVHFDLKGAAPKVTYILQLIPFLKNLHIDGILIEYEDMFPYIGYLEPLRRPEAYSESEIMQIIQVAQENNIEMIPLIQTFGHLEFVLKHLAFSHLREDPFFADTICPSDEESFKLISEMLRQVRRLHRNSSAIHIGVDEAHHIAKDARCETKLRDKLDNSTDRLKLWHITRVAMQAHELGFHDVWAWNDMFGNINAELMHEFNMGKALVPVVWGYARDVTMPGYFPPNMFERYAAVFDTLLFGSAFKGANGRENAFIDVFRYLANQISYVELLRLNNTELNGRVKGIILTGWQRYNHFSALCELLPVGIPSLVLAVHFLNNTSLSTSSLLKMTQKTLGCSINLDGPESIQFENVTYIRPIESLFVKGTFPGNEVFDLVEELRSFTSVIFDQNISSNAKYGLQAEISVLERKIRDTFRIFFEEYTIDEFISQNVTPLKMQTF